MSCYQTGDRVRWNQASNAVYEVVRISEGHATLLLLEYYQKGREHPATKRRVPFWQIEPLDVVSSTTNDDAKSSRGCVHTLVPVWTNEIQLQFFCTRCSYSEPVRDPAVLKSTYQLVESVMAEYQQALAQANSQARKREFEQAIATKKQQLEHIAAVLGETAHSPAEPKTTHSVIIYSPEAIDDFPLEPEQQQSEALEEGSHSSSRTDPQPVLGETDSYAPVIPLEPGLKKGKASGWLEQYTKTKKLKSGVTATYPLCEGERDPDNPEHWYWAYRYEEKRENARSDNGYVTRAVSLPRVKVEAVQLVVALGWSVAKILQFIRGEL